MTAPYEFKIGSFAGGAGGLQLLPTLGITNPAYDFILYSAETDLGDGGVRGLGWRMTQWHWTFIPTAQLNVLKTYCSSGRSNDICIRTATDIPGTWANFSGKIIWPQKISFSNEKALDFTLLFRALVPLA